MRIDNETVKRWTETATAWLATRSYVPTQVVTGVDAWTIASVCGFTKEAYAVGASDGHIQTALQRIFPNARFQDAKRYA